MEVQIADRHGVPRTLVLAAKEKKLQADKAAKKADDDNLRYDEVWCVYDVDDHPALNDARQMAEANGLHLAVSNPCFELWLLLHVCDSPGACHRDELRQRLKASVPAYDKHVDFKRFQAGYDEAVARAGRLDRQAADIDEEGSNPSTGVYRLTESIRQ